MTGQNDRPDESMTGQAHDQAGQCPLTGRYFEPCYVRKGQKKLPASVFYCQLSLLKMDTFRTDTKYPSKREIRLVESQIKEGTNSRCRPVLQRGAHVIEVSINKELTIFIFKRQCI